MSRLQTKFVVEDYPLLLNVKKMDPLHRLAYWIYNRESIRIKKDAGEPGPP